MKQDQENASQELVSERLGSPRPALDTWRWRLGIALLSFAAAWLVSGSILMWLLIWKPLAIGHAAFWVYVLVVTSEQMRRYYFDAIQQPRKILK